MQLTGRSQGHLKSRLDEGKLDMLNTDTICVV